MDENIAIADIESKLIGEWISDDSAVTYNFFSTPIMEEAGQLDITHNNNFSTVSYNLFISNKTPHLKIIDEANNSVSVYALTITEGEQRTLLLENEAGEVMNFIKQ